MSSDDVSVDGYLCSATHICLVMALGAMCVLTGSGGGGRWPGPVAFEAIFALRTAVKQVNRCDDM